jgi:hypothetical protein
MLWAVKSMQENVSCMELSAKIEKSVTAGELFPLGNRFFHLHLTLMQDTFNICQSVNVLYIQTKYINNTLILTYCSR